MEACADVARTLRNPETAQLLRRPRHRRREAGQRGGQLLRMRAGDAIQLAGENAADGSLPLFRPVLQHST